MIQPQRGVGKDPAAVASSEQSLLTGPETIFSSQQGPGWGSEAELGWEIDGHSLFQNVRIAERVSHLGTPPSGGGSRHQSHLRQQRHRLPKAAVSSEPVAEQIKTVGGGGAFTPSQSLEPEALSGSYLDSGDPV